MATSTHALHNTRQCGQGGGFLSHLFSKACALIQALPLDRLLVVLAVAAAALGATKHPCREALAVPLEALGLDALATPGMLHQGLGGVQLGLREAGKVLAVGRLVDPDGLGLPDLGLEGVRGLLLRLGPRLVDHVGELDVVVAVVAVALWAAKLTPRKAVPLLLLLLLEDQALELAHRVQGTLRAW